MVKWNISERYDACHHTILLSELQAEPVNKLNNALPFSPLCVIYQTVPNYETIVTDRVGR
jgi:hypothetical protein